jgi:uncharacterized protein (DUF608 family)
LAQVAFPLGGLGAGMICIEGNGTLSKFSLRHRPDLTSEPTVFAAVSLKGPQRTARVLEGPVPDWKLRPQYPGSEFARQPTRCWGLPRFHRATFEARFPFAIVRLKDDQMPLEVELTAWSPFCPGDADNSSLPVAGIEYQFINRSQSSIEAVFSFNAENFMAAPPDQSGPSQKPSDRIRSTPGGFILCAPGSQDRPWEEGYFAAWIDDPHARINHAWIRGGLNDSLRTLWSDIESGDCPAGTPLSDGPAPGASIYVPFSIAPSERKTIKLQLGWYVPSSNLGEPKAIFKDGGWIFDALVPQTHKPWYAGRFATMDDLIGYWQSRYHSLRQASEKFTAAFYSSTLPPEVIEAVAANFSILKSPTILRQTDGRLWGWEGCKDSVGAWYGSATHVWNYAQSIAHLFPELERTLRETEFGPNQNEQGHQFCRAALPIRTQADGYTLGDAVPDGQLGGIIKAYRDWRISGDTEWLRGLWPRIRASLDYCIRTWDPMERGWIEEPHLNTYDLEFWGADSLCTGLYVGALKAATLMGSALNERVERYSRLLQRGIHRMENELFNGEYFFQNVAWRNLKTPFPRTDDPWTQLVGTSKYPAALSKNEGPKYQYGPGCLSDGVMGAWLCLVSGAGDVLDRGKVASHLSAAYRHNLKRDLTDHANLSRAMLACGDESGLLICTWPKGGKPALPMVYADEVWSGIEYQVASHLVMLGALDQGLDIIRSCRSRYDGRIRNPFDEIEAGHWYARAMSSYALLQAFSGARFDAVDKILYLSPAIKGDFRCFLCTATGFGTVGIKAGQPFVEIASGDIPYTKINYGAIVRSRA